MPAPVGREGLLKKIVVLGVFAALLAIGARTLPVYLNNSRLSDYIRERALRASAERPAPGALQAEVVHYALSLGLPLKLDDVQVTASPGAVAIRVDYTVPVDLKLCTWNLRFTPWVESRAY